MHILDPDCALVFQKNSLGMGACDDGEVGAVKVWRDEGLGRTPALTAVLHRLCRSDAELLLAVVIFGLR